MMIFLIFVLISFHILYPAHLFRNEIYNPITIGILNPNHPKTSLESWKNIFNISISGKSRNDISKIKSQRYLKLIGSGSNVPSNIIENNDLEKIVDTSDQWITQRTGISRRHVLSAGESLSQLSVKAASRALRSANIDPLELDLIIHATSSPDDLFGDSCYIANAIGADNACSFDITAACSGFIFGLITASQYIENGTYKNILVVGADGLSQWVDWGDRNTCILFGDGAGAVVCQSTDNKQENGILGWALHSDGKKRQHLTLGRKYLIKSLNTEMGHTINVGNYKPIHMNGKDVFLFATREVPGVIKEALTKANLSIEDIDWLLLHQANQRILKAVAEKLGIPPHKILSNIKDYGNTSAASIPLCLDEAISTKKVKKGDVIAMAGFGAGLSWGASIVKWGA